MKVRYDLIGAAKSGVSIHPQKKMERLGFDWDISDSMPIGDCWVFNLVKWPAMYLWPSYIKKINEDEKAN